MLSERGLMAISGASFGRTPNVSPQDAQVAQSVEQGTENPRVGGSIPSLGTTY